MKKVLILGGAGFIGSNIAKRYVFSKHKVTIIDGFLEKTGASESNIISFKNKVLVIKKRVEDINNLIGILDQNDLIIDSMGWTAHHLAVENPDYDIQLNLLSHLKIISALKKLKRKNIIYIGSRGQYGNVQKDLIEENDCMIPVDVQGINKMSAEFYYKVYSKFYNYKVVSLRIPNCFGFGQIVHGTDIGLIGSFIKESLSNNTIKVYGNDRKRSLLYVEDLVNYIYRLGEKNWQNSFEAYNINGITVSIVDLLNMIVKLTKSGNIKIEKMPAKVKKIDGGSAGLSEKKLIKELSFVKTCDLENSLIKTIEYFKNRL